MQGLEIMEASISEAAQILELQKLAYQSEAKLYNDPSLAPLTQTLPELEGEFASMTILKAVLQGRLAGSVRAREQDGTCHIGRLMVHPKVQRRGIGARLMQEIESCFPGARRFELFTGHRSFSNLAFYAGLGYRQFKERRINPGLTIVWLSKLNK